MISITAVIRIVAGKGDEAASVFRSIVEAVAEEERTLAYAVARGIEDDHLFTVYEQYPDEAALKAHQEGRAYTQVQAPLRSLLDGKPEVIRATTIASAR